MELAQFDVMKLDSGTVTLETPQQLAERLMKALQRRPLPTEENGWGEDYLYRALTDISVSIALGNSPDDVLWLRRFVAFLECGYGDALKPELANGVLPYLTFQGRTVAFMPNLSDALSVARLFDGISEISYTETPTNHWILDCSELRQVSFHLLGHLIGLKQMLAEQQARITFVWLPQMSLPPEYEDIMRRHFKLAKKGVFLLSHGE